MKLSEFFDSRHIDASFFEANGKINFGLWYKEAEYSVLIQKAGTNRIAACLLKNDVSFEDSTFDFKSAERSITTSFNDFLKGWNRLEDEVLPDRTFQWWEKPFRLWKKLEELL